MMESIQKYREFSMVHGGLLESEDVLGRRMGQYAVNHLVPRGAIVMTSVRPSVSPGVK